MLDDMTDLLPEALVDALGAVVAELRREWRKELEIISAESRALVAEHRLALDGGKLDTLVRRIDEIEQRGIRFEGVWQRALSYGRGAMVVHGGSLWACVGPAEAAAEPGKSAAWQLAAKAGKDAAR